MKVNGEMIMQKVLGNIGIVMAYIMKEILKKINRMEKVEKNGQMVRYIWAIIKKDKKMEKVNICSQVVINILVNLVIIN